ncbi:MAG: alpha/beta hydrolase [Candidatus Heimdallarchaeota archaeon]|nr:alpha/beta hydrolase [Candidatus Heimdallarchaeota archaeon]
MNSGVMETNGQNLYYEVHGEGSPLVLIMGLGYDSSLWGLQQIPAFSKEYKVIVFDNRDVGRSSQANETYSLVDMANDLAGLLDGLGVNKAHILGFSMGGAIAQEFAINHPEKVDKLILVGTAADDARASFDALNVWKFVKNNDSQGMVFATQQFVWLFSDDFLRNKDAVNQTLQLLGSNPNPQGPDAFSRQVDAAVKHDSLDRLNQIQAKTLVISSERDLIRPPWMGKKLADGIPKAKFKLIEGPGASHVVVLERPEEFNNIVLHFLKE